MICFRIRIDTNSKQRTIGNYLFSKSLPSSLAENPGVFLYRWIYARLLGYTRIRNLDAVIIMRILQCRQVIERDRERSEENEMGRTSSETGRRKSQRACIVRTAVYPVFQQQQRHIAMLISSALCDDIRACIYRAPMGRETQGKMKEQRRRRGKMPRSWSMRRFTSLGELVSRLCHENMIAATIESNRNVELNWNLIL